MTAVETCGNCGAIVPMDRIAQHECYRQTSTRGVEAPEELETALGAIDYLKEAGHPEASYDHTGGGIWCILVDHPRRRDSEDTIYIGTADGYWGWSDYNGTDYGYWKDLEPVCDGNELAARILGIMGDLKARQVTIDGRRFYPYAEQSAWYEVGTAGEVGTLYAPMYADGRRPTSDDLAEISERYDGAAS